MHLTHLCKSSKISLQKKLGFCTQLCMSNYFHFPTSVELATSSAAPVAQTVGWMVHKFPVKQLQQLLCLMYAVWGCTVVVLQHNICSGHYRNTPEIAICTVMRKWKWLCMNGCKSISPITSATKFVNSCQGGENV